MILKSMRVLRLHGEDGAVYLTSASGKKLWRLDLRDVSVSEDLNDIPYIILTALGKAVAD